MTWNWLHCFKQLEWIAANDRDAFTEPSLSVLGLEGSEHSNLIWIVNWYIHHLSRVDGVLKQWAKTRTRRLTHQSPFQTPLITCHAPTEARASWTLFCLPSLALRPQAFTLRVLSLRPLEWLKHSHGYSGKSHLDPKLVCSPLSQPCRSLLAQLF